MTIGDLKINGMIHLCLSLFGATCCLLAAAEAYWLYGQTALFAWACAAMAASYWFERRMIRHAKRIRGQICYLTQLAALQESLDNVFEHVMGRTRERHDKERRRAA